MSVDFRTSTHGRTSSDGSVEVEVRVWELYAYVSARVYKSQSRGCYSMYDRTEVRIVRLNRSASPIVCGFYVVVNTFLVFKIQQTS